MYSVDFEKNLPLVALEDVLLCNFEIQSHKFPTTKVYVSIPRNSKCYCCLLFKLGLTLYKFLFV